MSFFNSPKTTGDNNLTQIRDPLKKMQNALIPKTQGENIGSPSFKMPENAGDSQMRAGHGMMRSSLGSPTKPMPSYPHQALPTDTSLLHSISPKSALAGIKRPPSSSSIGKHLF